jgi:hypothetical protein
MVLRDINLIPEETLRRLHVKRHLLFWAGCLLLVFTMICGFHLYQTKLTLADKSPLQTIKKTDRDFIAKMDEIKKLEKELAMLNQKQAVLAIINKGPTFSLIIWKMVHMINEYTWFSKLSLDRSKGKNEEILLQLAGFSFRNEALGDFLNRLSTEPLFKTVSLKHARETKTGSFGQVRENREDPIQFQIDCEISGEKGS